MPEKQNNQTPAPTDAEIITHPHPLLVPLMAGGLSNLSDNELAELDQMINPRTAALLTKAFGPEMAIILDPLVAGEEMDNSNENETPTANPHHEQRNQLRQLMRDPRYWRDRNPEFVQRVAEGFSQIHQ